MNAALRAKRANKCFVEQVTTDKKVMVSGHMKKMTPPDYRGMHSNLFTGGLSKRGAISGRRLTPLQKISLQIWHNRRSKIPVYGLPSDYRCRHRWLNDITELHSNYDANTDDADAGEEEGENEFERSAVVGGGQEGDSPDVPGGEESASEADETGANPTEAEGERTEGDKEDEEGIAATGKRTKDGPSVADVFKSLLEARVRGLRKKNQTDAVVTPERGDEAYLKESTTAWKVRESQVGVSLDRNRQFVGDKHSICNVFTSGRGTKELLDRSVCVVVQLPKEKEGCVCVQFGPMIDHTTNRAFEVGHCMPATTVYSMLGLPHTNIRSHCWGNNSRTLNGVALRFAEKNGIYEAEEGEVYQERWSGPRPADADEKEVDFAKQLDPLADLVRSKRGEDRLGFEVNGTGGAPHAKGQHAPTGKGMAGAHSAIFETEQTLDSAENLALAEAAKVKRILQVFLAGNYLKKDAWCSKDLIQYLGKKKEQAIYLGLYRVHFRGHTEPKKRTKDGWKRYFKNMVVFHKDRFPEIREELLRAKKEVQLKFWFEPVHVDTAKEFTRIDVRADDPTCIMYQVPDGINQSQLLKGTGEHTVFREEAIDDFWANNRHTEYAEEVCDGPVSTRTRNNLGGSTWEKNVKDWNNDAEHVEGSQEKYLCPKMPAKTGVALQETWLIKEGKEVKLRGVVIGAKRSKHRKRGDIMSIVLKGAFAGFSRMAKVNIDKDGKIFQLVDPPSKSKDFPRHRELFGKSERKLLEEIGPPFQRSPVTHPCRIYDAHRLHLFHCCGGLEGKQSRNGMKFWEENDVEFANIGFQCFLAEAMNNTSLLIHWHLWEESKEDGGTFPLVPKLEDIWRYKFFQDCFQEFNGHGNSIKLFSTGSYTKFRNLLEKKSFHLLLDSMLTEFEPFMKRLRNIIKEETQKKRDPFWRAIVEASKFLGEIGVDDDDSDSVRFFCQHWMMNINEVCDDFPMGVPNKVVMKFGSHYGLDMMGVKDKASLEFLSNWCKDISNIDDDWLCAIGLVKQGEVVFVAINMRPVTSLEPEHWSCVGMFYVERSEGGTRGFSDNPRIDIAFLDPIKAIRGVEGSELHRIEHANIQFAEARVRDIRELVQNGRWKQAMENGNLLDKKKRKAADAVTEEEKQQKTPRNLEGSEEIAADASMMQEEIAGGESLEAAGVAAEALDSNETEQGMPEGDLTLDAMEPETVEEVETAHDNEQAMVEGDGEHEEEVANSPIEEETVDSDDSEQAMVEGDGEHEEETANSPIEEETVDSDDSDRAMVEGDGEHEEETANSPIEEESVDSGDSEDDLADPNYELNADSNSTESV